MGSFDRIGERLEFHKQREAGERCYSLGPHSGELLWTYPDIPGSRVCKRHMKIATEKGFSVEPIAARAALSLATQKGAE